MGETCDTCGRKERRLQGVVGKTIRNRLLGRARRRCTDNIRMGLQEVEWEQELG
jgi:hypothetical protein